MGTRRRLGANGESPSPEAFGFDLSPQAGRGEIASCRRWSFFYRSKYRSSFRGAQSANPESITTIVSMDSGPAPNKAHPGMTMVDELLQAYTRNSRA
jgi:hypothetical protein